MCERKSDREKRKHSLGTFGNDARRSASVVYFSMECNEPPSSRHSARRDGMNFSWSRNVKQTGKREGEKDERETTAK